MEEHTQWYYKNRGPRKR
uniref:Uncharacterized protein n=1 Tax=Anguilla anguilla TaxID=7936 RepID=A0A0E9TBY2_ANGAN